MGLVSPAGKPKSSRAIRTRRPTLRIHEVADGNRVVALLVDGQGLEHGLGMVLGTDAEVFLAKIRRLVGPRGALLSVLTSPLALLPRE